MLWEIVLLTIVGKILTHLWMSFPLPKWLGDTKIGELHDCEKCSGFWIYSVVFVLFGADIFPLLGLPQLDAIGGILTGGVIINFMMFLMTIGFREQYMSFEIE